MISVILIVIITVFLPPVGVYLVAGCGADVLVNCCLTLLGVFPGHIHAFYVEYEYFHRRDEARAGRMPLKPAPGIYSQNVQSGGQSYGAVGQIGAPAAASGRPVPPPGPVY